MNDIRRIQQLNEDLIIRRANLSDASGFTSLMNKYYPRKDKVKYFSWRFFSCPTPSILYVVTTKDNAIIGAHGINIFNLSNGKRCGLCIDLIIETNFTKRGLLYLLEKKGESFAKKNNCSYLLSLSNTNGMKAYSQIDGWIMFGQIPLMVFQPENINYSQKNHFTHNLFNEKQVFFEYDKSLLNWRFNKSPEYKYFKIKSGKDVNYVKIYYDSVKNILFGDIVYYPASLNSLSDFSVLIDKSIQALQKMRAQTILTWCNQKSFLYKIFLSKGFTVENQTRYLCIKPLKANVNPNLLNWQIVPADSEVF